MLQISWGCADSFLGDSIEETNNFQLKIGYEAQKL